MTSQTGKQIIAINILPNISKGKGNQAMKFDQLTEYNMINIFLKKSQRKSGGKTSLRTFYEKSKLSVTLDQQSVML